MRAVEDLLPYIRDTCDEVGDCWVWRKSYSRGYPQMGARAIPAFPHNVMVYRVVFFLANGRHPAQDKAIHHTCFNRACCNPTHLVEMTTAEHNLLHAIERHKSKDHEYRPKLRGRGCAECNRIAAKAYRHRGYRPIDRS